VDVHAASFTLDTLLDDSVEERTTVFAESWSLVSMDIEAMRDVNAKTISKWFGHGIFDSRAFGNDKLMASLVDNTCTNLTLVALFADSKYKLFTVRTEGRLTKKRCHKFVSINLMDSSSSTSLEI
jgi:hypothetical protein